MTKTETNGPKMSEIMLRSTIKIKKTSPFILYCAHFFVPLAPPKVLAFDNKNKKTACFYFVLCSLFRTFATYPLCGHKEVNVKRLRS